MSYIYCSDWWWWHFKTLLTNKKWFIPFHGCFFPSFTDSPRTTVTFSAPQGIFVGSDTVDAGDVAHRAGALAGEVSQYRKSICTWLVVSTPLKKYESQWEGLSHILWKIKHVPNHGRLTMGSIWVNYNIFHWPELFKAIKGDDSRFYDYSFRENRLRSWWFIYPDLW